MRDSYVYSAGCLKCDDNKTINIITIIITIISLYVLIFTLTS